MLVHTQTKHDLTCWAIAIGLHLLLLRVNFNLCNKVDEAKNLVPVVEVEYITQEEIISTRIARMPGRLPQTFKEKLKHFFSKEVVPPKKEELLAGKAPSPLKVDKIKGLSPEKSLIDKEVSLPRKVDISPVNKSKEKLMSKEEDKILLGSSKEVKLTDSKTENLKDKGYKVAKGDLPFNVATGDEIRGKDIDIVGIDLGNKTSKNILTQAPSLKDMKGKAEIGEGVFRVVKQEEEKLSGPEVLANLLSMAKEEEEKKLKEYESLLGSGGALKEKERYGEGVGKAAEDAGKKEYRKGVVFSRSPEKESGSAASSVSKADEEAGKREQKGRVIFEIRGPLSRRKILYRNIPSYPEWAEKEGIEAGVSVHFVVLSDGKVKDNIYVVRTSGYPFIDKLVMEALKNWEFASLEGDLYGKEEWGLMTFYFSLNSKLAKKE